MLQLTLEQLQYCFNISKGLTRLPFKGFTLFFTGLQELEILVQVFLST